MSDRNAAILAPSSALTVETVLSVRHWNEHLFSFTITRPQSFRFRSGEFVMIGLPGEGRPLLRAYSIASPAWAEEIEFLSIKVPDGPLTSRLQQIQPGDPIFLGRKPTGTLVTDALLPGKRLFFLSTGTGLAPFLSMLERLAETGAAHPVHLVYGVTRDADLVLVDRLEAIGARLPGFTFATCVADAASTHPRKGFVTEDLDAAHLHDGDVDAYLCGPPAMVEAVRTHFAGQGITPASFHFEKFSPSGVVTGAA